MGYITDKDLAAIREAFLDTMTETATITRQNWVDDGAGGKSKGAPSVTTNIPCHVGSSSLPVTRQIAGKTVSESTYIVSFPVDTDVITGDVITVNGSDYEVIGMKPGSPKASERAHCLKIS